MSIVLRPLSSLLRNLLSMALGPHQAPPPPILVVCGATGTGKTKLGIELAQRCNGEVINADAIQLYAGLDIATNKADAEEMAGVPHHLLGVLDPLNESHTVRDFQAAALDRLREIRARGRSPVVVGGTHYYIEAILWDFLVTDLPQERHEGRLRSRSRSPAGLAYEGSAEELHARLAELDPSSAARIHPNDRRKVRNALDTALASGVTLSARLQRQHVSPGAVSGGLRFPGQALLFWADAAAPELARRLDRRVQGMLERGLVAELQRFHREFNAHRGSDGDTAERYQTGVWQAIGFKEFHPFLELSEVEQRTEAGQKLLAQCVERLQISTRQYARRQRQWVRNRFLRRAPAEAVPVFRMDTTHPERWPAEVSARLGPILDFWQRRGATGGHAVWAQCPVAPEPLAERPEGDGPALHVCAACGNQRFVREEQWRAHLRSRRHQRRTASLRKRAAAGGGHGGDAAQQRTTDSNPTAD